MPKISATGDGRTQPGSADSQHAGFTLIELLVVLTIMVLLSASIPMALNRVLPARRVHVSAEDLITDIRWLQEQAARGKQPGRLEISPGGYRLSTDGAAFRQVALAHTTTIRLHASGEQRSLQQLVVYPDGTATPANFEIEDSGRAARVEVGMLTGRARRLHGNP